MVTFFGYSGSLKTWGKAQGGTIFPTRLEAQYPVVGAFQNPFNCVFCLSRLKACCIDRAEAKR
jgi:hypothetical protein